MKISSIEKIYLFPSISTQVTGLPSIIYLWPRATIPALTAAFKEHSVLSDFLFDLFSENLETFSVLDPNQVILEVKFNDYLPESLAIILTTIPSFRQAVSKFALGRAIK